MAAEVLGQLALIIVVTVNVVSPGRGLVTSGQGDFSGTIVLDRGHTRLSVPGTGPYLVETESGDVISRARSYRQGAEILAARGGYPRPAVTVEIEHERE
jgi:hypothetical protein